MHHFKKPFTYLNELTLPKHLQVASQLLGVKEIVGNRHNPVILGWADELGSSVGSWYTDDEKPWCGLFAAVCLKRAGWLPPAGFKALRALEYSHWGKPVKWPYCIGDIAVYERPGGGHVNFLVAQGPGSLAGLGGNQKNGVNITDIQRKRLVAVVRPPYKNYTPIRLPTKEAQGPVSDNEA